MTREEKLQRLVEIQKESDENRRIDSLKELAKVVGASTAHTKIVGASTRQSGTTTETTIYQNPISESELVQNINNALQTETMIDMCRIANRNFWIAVTATIAAVISATAAWVAVCK